MNPQMKDVLSIDFGTTNTYLTRCAAGTRNPGPIQFDANSVGIETAMLYSNESAELSPYIGEQAVNGFGMASDEERRQYEYRFKSHFKPDILESEEARNNARDFFAAMLRDARKLNLRFDPLNCQVIIGVPSEASLSYRETLKAVARDAGYGEVELLDEPIGAMLDGIASNMFPLSDIISGFLVIDFGGGTCDFAFLKNGRVQHSWGDMHLGGRLFDDLFYRWYCDLNPGKEQELQKSGDDFFVRVYHCRRWKESFSQFMAKTTGKTFSYVLGSYGKVANITWDDFLQRARCYRPTESFLRFQKESGASLPESLTSGETDLLRWFADSLESGLKEAKIALKDIHVIALAGGSCQWSFISEYCREILKNESFFRSNQPYATIANGLAVLPALEREFDLKQRDLSAKLPNFVRGINESISRELASGRTRIVSKILSELFDARIRPILLEFREKGGTVTELENRIGTEATCFEKRINTIVAEEIGENMHTLFAMVLDHVRTWLKENDLRMAEVEEDARFSAGKVDLGRLDPKVAETIVTTVNTIVGTIITIVVANICGGGGMALLASGPFGLLLGGVLGVAVAMLAATMGREKATQLAKSVTIPTNVSPIPGTKLNPMNAILTDKKIQTCRCEMGKDLEKKLEEASEEILNEVQSKTERLIRDEIARLNIVHLR